MKLKAVETELVASRQQSEQQAKDMLSMSSMYPDKTLLLNINHSDNFIVHHHILVG